MSKKIESQNVCSFCGTRISPATLVVSGLGAFICANCIQIASKIVAERESNRKKEEAEDVKPLPSPAHIKKHLDQYVIGQHEAKETLSIAVYNHYKRLQFNAVRNPEDVELEKSNVLLVGPTGCGKTMLARAIAELLDVPFAIADATVLTEAGYVGEDVDSIISRLLQAADMDPKRAEHGIIFLDEIDKIARKSSNPSITRDVSGEGVQQGLLKLLEGTIAKIAPQGGRKHPEQQYVSIDTRNILFICGGAFEGLEKIISARTDRKGGMGFGAHISNREEKKLSDLFKKCEPDDLVRFGLMPELVGRLPVTVSLKELDIDALRQILTEPKNSIIRQYTKMLELDGIELTFDDDALNAIAEVTIRRNTGARGLRSVVEGLLHDAMFNGPDLEDKHVHITADMVHSMYGAESDEDNYNIIKMA